jgi:hypothetical protein
MPIIGGGPRLSTARPRNPPGRLSTIRGVGPLRGAVQGKNVPKSGKSPNGVMSRSDWAPVLPVKSTHRFSQPLPKLARSLVMSPFEKSLLVNAPNMVSVSRPSS